MTEELPPKSEPSPTFDQKGPKGAPTPSVSPPFLHSGEGSERRKGATEEWSHTPPGEEEQDPGWVAQGDTPRRGQPPPEK